MVDKPTYEAMEEEILALKKEISDLKRSGRQKSRDLVEEELHKSEKKYRTILDAMEEGYYETNLHGTFTFVNKAECRIHNRSLSEMIGLNNQEFSSPEIARKIYRIYNKVYKTGLPARIIDYEIIQKGGRKVSLETSASLLKNETGEPIGFYGISRDVTEKKEAELKLRESEEKYRLLVENANEGIFINQDGLIKFPNAKACAITGYSLDEMTGMAFADLVYGQDQQVFLDQQQNTLQGRKAPDTGSLRIRNKNGDILWLELNTVSLDWEGHPATLNFIRDVTPQKKMKAQLLQAQKMEAMGTLAGGIAHDFNNLLMGIQGNVSLALMDMEPDHPHYEQLRSVEQLVRNGAELTKQLLGTAKGGKYEVKPTDINDLIERSANLFGRTRKEVSIHKKLSKNIGIVEIDRSQIEQVLLNLYVNAWHAMPDGGELYLETQNVTLEEYYTKTHGVEPGKFVLISVTDTGIGMDEATRQKVFDPFFTTKKMGRGTGLGLASAYGIIANHNGMINVYSEVGEGTTFNIYLPLSKKKAAEEAHSDQQILLGNETILFVDDEQTIIDIGLQLLKKLGYNVISAKSGVEAIEIYRQKSSQVDLIILDMIMPGKSGGETFDLIKQINPAVKVILSSGYSINGQAQAILDRGCRGFLQKPFNLADLSKKLRLVLD